MSERKTVNELLVESERHLLDAAYSCVKEQGSCTCLACSWDRIAELEAENERLRILAGFPRFYLCFP